MNENDDQSGYPSEAQIRRVTRFIELLRFVPIIFVLALLGVVLVLVAAHWKIPWLTGVGECLLIIFVVFWAIAFVWFLCFEAWATSVYSVHYEGQRGLRAIYIALSIIAFAALIGIVLLVCSKFGGVHQFAHTGVVLVLPFGIGVVLYMAMLFIALILRGLMDYGNWKYKTKVEKMKNEHHD